MQGCLFESAPALTGGCAGPIGYPPWSRMSWSQLREFACFTPASGRGRSRDPSPTWTLERLFERATALQEYVDDVAKSFFDRPESAMGGSSDYLRLLGLGLVMAEAETILQGWRHAAWAIHFRRPHK